MLGKLSAVGNSKKNACRALHRLVESTGVTLKLPIEPVHCTIRRVKPVRICQAWWPTISMKSWVMHLLENYPKVLLAGHVLEDHGWKKDFYKFWEQYKSIEPSHPIYQGNIDWRFAVPYAFHGDEGRGKGKVPFLCISFQPIISHLGLGHCNDSTYFGLYSSFSDFFLTR